MKKNMIDEINNARNFISMRENYQYILDLIQKGELPKEALKIYRYPHENDIVEINYETHILILMLS